MLSCPPTPPTSDLRHNDEVIASYYIYWLNYFSSLFYNSIRKSISQLHFTVSWFYDNSIISFHCFMFWVDGLFYYSKLHFSVSWFDCKLNLTIPLLFHYSMFSNFDPYITRYLTTLYWWNIDTLDSSDKVLILSWWSLSWENHQPRYQTARLIIINSFRIS